MYLNYMNARGIRGGVVVRVLAFHYCGQGSIPGPSVICAWVEFIVGSQPCSEGFSLGTPVFLPPQKATFPNSNSIRKQWK